MKNKYLKFLVIATAVIIIVPQIALAAWWNPFSWSIWSKIWSIFYKQAPVACTQDAKLCPDGSYVSRQGPKCEFAPCPTDQTAGWETYRNDKYGFEFKYPEQFFTIKKIDENFKKSSTGGPGILFESLLRYNSKYPDIYGSIYNIYSISVQILENENQLSLEKWYEEYSKFTVSGGASLYEIKPIEVGGITGIKSEGENCCMAFGPTIFLPSKNIIYRIAGIGIGAIGQYSEKINEENETAGVIFNQILPTFKFTK